MPAYAGIHELREPTTTQVQRWSEEGAAQWEAAIDAWTEHAGAYDYGYVTVPEIPPLPPIGWDEAEQIVPLEAPPPPRAPLRRIRRAD